MDKVEAEIQAADLIIGDLTYTSPNVFYELGIARANRKPIVFMTQDDPKTAPVDLRHFEFIHYDLGRDQELLAKLDNAIQNTLGGDYAALLEQAVALLHQFNADTSSTYAPASLDEFRARLLRGEMNEGIPDSDDSRFAEFLLPKVVADATDISVIRQIDKWLSVNSKASSLPRQQPKKESLPKRLRKPHRE